jgi:hypothetical protein
MRYKPKDRSGAIVEGGKAQNFMSVYEGRNGAWIQNNSAGDLWINELGDAAPRSPSLRLAPGALYEFHNEGVTTTAVSVYGANTGQEFSAREW